MGFTNEKRYLRFLPFYFLYKEMIIFAHENQFDKMRKLRNSELGRLDVEQFKDAKKIPLIIILDNIRSLNNIGSVFRTADAFLIEKVYLI